jgi:hypothetical protein
MFLLFIFNTVIMINYLFKILIFLGFSSIVIYNYYFQSGHIENFDGYFPYLITVGILYGVYKYIQVNFSSKKDIATFTPLTILGFFLLHLFILCGLFFVFNANPFIS